MAKPGKHKVVPGANKKVVSLQHEIIRQSGGLITKDVPQKKKEKKKGKKKVNPLARPRDAESFQREIARQYGGGLIHSGAEQQKPAKVQGQLPGESYKQFTRRLAEDSRKAILEETRKNRKSSARRKKYASHHRFHCVVLGQSCGRRAGSWTRRRRENARKSTRNETPSATSQARSRCLLSATRSQPLGDLGERFDSDSAN